MLSGWKCQKVILTLLSDKMNFWLPGQPKLPRTPKLGERLEVYCELENTAKRFLAELTTDQLLDIRSKEELVTFWSAEAKYSAK